MNEAMPGVGIKILQQYEEEMFHHKKKKNHSIYLSLGFLPSLPTSPLAKSLIKYRKYCVNSKLHTSYIIWD